MSNARAVRRRVAPYPIDEDGNTVKLTPRLVSSKHSSRPKLLVPSAEQGEQEPLDDRREQRARRTLAVIERGGHCELREPAGQT